MGKNGKFGLTPEAKEVKLEVSRFRVLPLTQGAAGHMICGALSFQPSISMHHRHISRVILRYALPMRALQPQENDQELQKSVR
jgi:hypothetical protein